MHAHRYKCGVPVIIEGETGVGKTALLEMLSKLWNHALLLGWKRQRGRLLDLMMKNLGDISTEASDNYQVSMFQLFHSSLLVCFYLLSTSLPSSISFFLNPFLPPSDMFAIGGGTKCRPGCHRGGPDLTWTTTRSYRWPGAVLLPVALHPAVNEKSPISKPPHTAGVTAAEGLTEAVV